MIVGRHVRVTGRVQGVFFRAWTQEQAREVGVAGWVRNCADGSVEAHLEGDEDAVETLISRMRDGPQSARVGDVKVGEVAPDGLVGFVVRH